MTHWDWLRRIEWRCQIGREGLSGTPDLPGKDDVVH